MSGKIEAVLTRRYGPPRVVANGVQVKWVWNHRLPHLECVLFKVLYWDASLSAQFGSLEALYGDVRGGFLLGDSLKLSLISGPREFGLYSTSELCSQEEVQRANRLDSEIKFCMDASNVWFYGSKVDELFVYDAATDELDDLGPFEVAFDCLLAEYEDAIGPS